MTDTTLSYPGHPIQDLSNKLVTRLRQIRRRRKMTRLLDLSDQMLNDIGVTRGEIDLALRSPLSTDAATELRRMSLERRKRRM